MPLCRHHTPLDFPSGQSGCRCSSGPSSFPFLECSVKLFLLRAISHDFPACVVPLAVIPELVPVVFSKVVGVGACASNALRNFLLCCIIRGFLRRRLICKPLCQALQYSGALCLHAADFALELALPGLQLLDVWRGLRSRCGRLGRRALLYLFIDVIELLLLLRNLVIQHFGLLCRPNRLPAEPVIIAFGVVREHYRAH